MEKTDHSHPDVENVSVDEEPPRSGSHVPGQILKHANDADEAMKEFHETRRNIIKKDEATNKRLLRRIDMNLMLNYLDKTTLSYASVMGIKKDIDLVGDDYQWLGSMFYFGYLGWEYPTNRLLQRLPLGKYSAFNVFFWGVVLACFAGVENFAGAVAVRFFLGVFEAAVTPGFALLTSQWWASLVLADVAVANAGGRHRYTKREQGFRTSLWFSFNGVAQIVGGLIAYGIAVGARERGAAIESWKIVFLVTGLLTAAMGVVFWFFIPDNQLNAWFLSRRDRLLAVERIRQNEQGVGNKHWKVYQFKEALTDPLTWMFFFYSLAADIPNGGITNFFSQLIVSFGYTKEQSLLYGTPGGAIEIVTIICMSHDHRTLQAVYAESTHD